MEAVLGIDVGGTSIKAGLFTPEGELLEERKIPTPALVDDAAYAAVTDGLKRILDAHDATPEDVIACGLDIPGPVADDGTVGFLPNIKLDPEGLVGAISSVFPRAQIAFVNDANAAALGEMWAGVAHGSSSYVLIALGTGVGAAVGDGSAGAAAQPNRVSASTSTMISKTLLFFSILPSSTHQCQKPAHQPGGHQQAHQHQQPAAEGIDHPVIAFYPVKGGF